MPNAVIVDIAEAIKVELNGGAFSPAIIARRSYADFNTKLTDLETLTVDVVPWKTTTELDDRGEITYRCEVDILIRQRFNLSDQASTGRVNNSEVDALVKLLQDVHEFFIAPGDGRKLTSVPNAAWVESRIVADYVRQHFKQDRQYTGWLRLTYEQTKAV